MTDKIHLLINRSLKKTRLNRNKIPDLEQWQDFISEVNQKFWESEQIQSRLERSLSLMSDEKKTQYRRFQDSTEARLRAITEALPDTLLLLDEDGSYLELLNPSYWYESGVSWASLDDVNLQKQLPPKAHRELIKAIRNAVDDNQQQIFDFTTQTPDGQRYFEGRVQALSRFENNKRTVIVLIRDVSEQRKAERARQLAQTIYEIAQEGMAVTDAQLNIVTSNESFSKITGLAEDGIQGCHIDSLDVIAENAFFSTLVPSLMRNHHWQGEVTGQQANKKNYPLWLSVSTVTDDSGIVTNYVAMLTDLSEIKHSQAELEYLATHDPLTGLANRVLFHERLDEAILHAQNNHTHGALFFLDLDRFKVVNDNLGHHQGDDLLCQVAERLKKSCYPELWLSRLGGDEFTIIAENLSDIKLTVNLAKKVLQAFSKPFVLDEYELNVTISMGISLFPEDSQTAAELVKQADTAMYKAKECGRNRYQFFTPKLTEYAFEFFALEVTLSRALTNNELFLEYQPQYKLEDGNLTGMEALVRWNHSEKGMLPPGRFIPMAEMTGLIEPLGVWVIKTVCHQISTWCEAGIAVKPVAVNLSPRQLGKPGLIDIVRQILEDEDIPSDLLEFEVTESAIFEREDIAYNNLNALRKLGCRLSIDDFGTGYSSLANLKRFSFDRLKIDQTFVRDATLDPNDDAIIAATIALGAKLGLTVIAEGVETKAQYRFLQAEGCPEVQGFLLSKPLNERKITRLLEDARQFTI